MRDSCYDKSELTIEDGAIERLLSRREWVTSESRCRNFFGVGTGACRYEKDTRSLT